MRTFTLDDKFIAGYADRPVAWGPLENSFTCAPIRAALNRKTATKNGSKPSGASSKAFSAFSRITAGN